MIKFKVKIHDADVSEHVIEGFEAAVEFAKKSKGYKGDIISEEGLVVLTVIPEGAASAPPPVPVPMPVVEAKPVIETKPKPVIETKPEPVIEAKPEPVIEAKPKPVIEAKPKPVIEAKHVVEQIVDKVEDKAPVINVFVDPDAIDTEAGEEAPIINIIVDSSEDIKSTLSKGINEAKSSNVKVTTVTPYSSRKKYTK